MFTGLEAGGERSACNKSLVDRAEEEAEIIEQLILDSE